MHGDIFVSGGPTCTFHTISFVTLQPHFDGKGLGEKASDDAFPLDSSFWVPLPPVCHWGCLWICLCSSCEREAVGDEGSRKVLTCELSVSPWWGAEHTEGARKCPCKLHFHLSSLSSCGISRQVTLGHTPWDGAWQGSPHRGVSGCLMSVPGPGAW